MPDLEPTTEEEMIQMANAGLITMNANMKVESPEYAFSDGIVGQFRVAEDSTGRVNLYVRYKDHWMKVPLQSMI